MRAIPGEGTQVPVWLLGSSTYSAQLAAVLGLPFGFASHFAPTYLEEALAIYREGFQPSKFLQQPYSLACVNIIAANTNEKAKYLATSFYQLALGMVRNRRRPLPPPVDTMDDLWSDAERAAIQQMMRYSFIGDTKTVAEELQVFTNKTNVDEIMVASHIYDLQNKINCYELIARLFKSTDS